MEYKIDKVNNKTIESFSGDVGDESFRINFDDDTYISFYHSQDCCETVQIEDIVGELNNHIGRTINGISIKTNSDDPAPDDGYDPESYTWTYITIKTTAGYIDLRFFGSSNGYYSESVDVKYYTQNKTYSYRSYNNYEEYKCQ